MTSSAQDDSNSKSQMWVVASRISYIGIFFGVAICIGFYAGRWADSRLHTAPWLSLVGLLLGIISSFTELLRIVMRYQRDLNRRDKERKEERKTR